MPAATTLDARLRRYIYDFTFREGSPPSIAQLAAALNSSSNNARAALAQLAIARVLVLQPESGEILMAPPFSAVPTSFVVQTRAHVAYANCAWDALGVSVMMNEPARISTSCGCCGEGLSLRTSLEGPLESDSIIHFAVPARRWWEDIVFT